MSSKNTIQYEASMEVFVQWFRNGVLSLPDLVEIDKKLTRKYGVDSSSIYRPECLLCSKSRANMSPTKEGGESIEKSNGN